MLKAQLEPDDYKEQNVDRILDLCYEKRCPVELLLHHLHFSFDKRGIRDYIINHFFTIDTYQLMFYVPEIVCMGLTRPPCTLENLVLHLCTSSTETFILVYWILSAWSHDLFRKKLMKKSMEKILPLCEEKWLSAQPKPEIRVRKNEFWTLLNGFIQKLTSFSLYLKQKPAENRKRMLKTFIKALNNFLLSRRQANSASDQSLGVRALAQGMIIPFTFTKNPESNIVVGILSDEIGCYETKKRCPYKIVFECISKEELSLKRENEKKTYSFVVSEEEEKEISDFKYEEVKIETKDAVESVSRFSALNDFALQKRIEEQVLECEKMVESESYHEEVKVFIKDRRFSGVPLHPLLVTKLQMCYRKKNGIYEFEERQKIQDKFSGLQKKVSSFSPQKRRLIPEELKKRVVFLKDVDKTFFQKNQKNLFDRRVRSEIEELEKKISEEEVFQNQKKSSKAEFESKFLKKVFAKLWRDQVEIFRRKSAFGHFDSYSLKPIMVKGGDDLRQEIISMQLMKKFSEIFEKEHVGCYLRPYEIVVTSHDSGFLEFLSDTIPLDALKKKYKTTLLKIYKKTWGAGLESARKNFIESLAGYSLFSYLLQIKDRHNGNLMISYQGHILHIDFGFMFTTSPGNINFENAPFKFTAEYLDLIGGKSSDFFSYFRNLMISGLKALQKNIYEVLNIVKIMSYQSLLSCFEKFNLTEFEDRFKASFSEKETAEYIDRLINDSLNSNRTVWYDEFQKITNKIER